MFGFDGLAIAGMSAAMIVGGIAKGVSGGGLPITALAIALFFVDARAGLALVVIPVLVTNLWQIFGNSNIFGPVKRFWPLIVVFCGGLYIGAQLVNVVDQSVLFMVIGVSTLIFTFSQIWHPNRPPLSPRAEKLFGPVVGIVGGLMGGLTTVWGPPLMMYLFALRLPKDTWVQTVNVMYLLGGIPLAILYVQNGVLAGDRMWLSVAACVPAMAGILIGERLRKRIDEALFRKVLLFVLFLIGLNMIRRAVF